MCEQACILLDNVPHSFENCIQSCENEFNVELDLDAHEILLHNLTIGNYILHFICDKEGIPCELEEQQCFSWSIYASYLFTGKLIKQCIANLSIAEGNVVNKKGQVSLFWVTDRAFEMHGIPWNKTS